MSAAPVNYLSGVTDFSSIYDSSYQSLVGGDPVNTGFICNITGKDLGSVFSLYANLGTSYTGNQGANCNYIKNGVDIGNLFVQKNTITPVVVTPPLGLLSNLPSGCTACFHCIWVNSNYTGAILNLRANTDSTGTSMQDFYIDKTGSNVTTGYNNTGQTLSNWLSSKSATIAYVNTWYDQSLSANHATQSVIGSQPTFNISGYIDFTGSKYLNILSNNAMAPGTSNFTISFKILSCVPVASGVAVIFGSGAGGYTGMGDSVTIRMESSTSSATWFDGNSRIVSTSNTIIGNNITLLYNNSTLTETYYNNTTSKSVGNTYQSGFTGRNMTAQQNMIGKGPGYQANYYFNSQLKKLIIFNNIITGTDLTTIQTLT